jgi:hypothetical protein
MTPPHGKFDPETMTDIQHAFWNGMTDQRVANMWDAAELIADMSPEAKEFLRRADKKKIEELESTLQFITNANIVRKFLMIAGATLVGGIIAVSQAWEWVSKIFIVKIK